MFTKKSIKIILAWLCIMVMLMPYMANVVTAAETVIKQTDTSLISAKITQSTKSATLTSIFPRMGEPGYKIGAYGILKIIAQDENELQETRDNFYCLEPNKAFPEATKEIYNNIGDLEDLNIEGIKSYKDEIGDAKYNSILNLSDLILFQDASSAEIIKYIEKVFAEKIDYDYSEGVQFISDEKLYDASSDENEYKQALIKEIIKYLSIEDIHVAQQLALWYLTNPTDNRYYEDTKNINYIAGTYKNGFNLDYYNSDDAAKVQNAFAYEMPKNIYLFNDILGQRIDIQDITKTYMNIVYNYLIVNSLNPYSNVPETGKFFTYPEIDKTVKPVSTISNDDNYYVVGPFKVTGADNTTYVDSETYEIKLSVENYELYSDRECTQKITETNLDNLLNKEYFVKVSSDINTSEVKLSITYEEKVKRVSTLWVPEDSNYQKVILVTQEKSSKDPQSVAVPLEKGDLALRKYIVSINGERGNFAPDVKLDDLAKNNNSTAKYNHAKNPVEVEAGDKIVYQINVYNEGTIDAIAKEITDYLPEGLSLAEDSSINEKYGWVLDGKTAKTTYLNETNLVAFKANEKEMTSAFVQIECIVDEGLNAEKVLTNVAEITADNIKDRDSKISSIIKDSINDNFSGNTSNKDDLTDSNYYYAGLEDDDDFAKVIIKGETFDLNLKKFIIKINGTKPTTSREPKVDTDNLKNGTSTNATYTMPKSSLTVKSGDVIKYKLRVYNESSISGYAESVVDYLPEGLGLLVNYNDNIDNFWSIEEAIENGAEIIELGEIENAVENLDIKDFTGETSLEKASVLVGKGAKIVSTKLASNKQSNLIEKFDGKSDKLNYKDIEVTCIVISDDLSDEQLKNIAEIQKALDDEKQEVEDRDSVPGSVNIDNYPGEDKKQDDHDYENLTQEDKKFDLSLQKFITGLNDEEITDRKPSISKNDKGEFKYSHKSEPLSVANKDLITYTIRVYNEGEKAGYAAEIQDDIPKGLVFVEENAINKKYNWKMYDKYGDETEDINQAISVKTDYLSKLASGEREEDCLIEAMNDIRTTPDYEEVKIVFAVDDSTIDKTVTTDKRIIINTAEISDDTDEKGNDVEDVDSKPANNKEQEDDIDKEKVYVKYFDLALEKFISKIVVIEIIRYYICISFYRT